MMKATLRLFILFTVGLMLLSACAQAVPPATTAPEVKETVATEVPLQAPTEALAPEPTADPEAAKYGGTFVLNLAGDPKSFNPDMVPDDYNFHISQNLHCRLVKMNLKNQIMPDLATSWEFSPDGKVATFHLAENALWHDGQPVTSADVKWTFEKIISEKAHASSGLVDVVSIETPDDYTAVFNLANTSAMFVSTLSWYGTYILPKHIYDGTDWLTNPANLEPIGCGSFKFVENTPGVSIVFEANDDYFYGRPYLDELIYQIIPDKNTAYQAFKNGELDNLAGGFPPAEVNSLDNNPNFKLLYNEGGGRDYLTFNFEDEHFGKPEVRQAVALGVDKDQIIEVALKGMGIKSEYYIPFNFTDFVNDDAKCPERDVAKARQILEEAGYVLGTDGYYFTSTFDVFSSGSSPDIAEVVVQNLKEIGINLEINMQEYAAWQDKVRDNKNFSITLLGGQQAPDVSATGIRLVTNGSMNFMNYSNPKVDELYALGSAEVNLEKRISYYKEAQVYLSEDIPHVPLSEYKSKLAIPAYVMDHAWTLDAPASAEWTFTWFQK
jgi:ABC-type transport system substrate-binding protein